MNRFSKVLLFNMCMIIDEEKNKVLVQDKVDEEWVDIDKLPKMNLAPDFDTYLKLFLMKI